MSFLRSVAPFVQEALRGLSTGLIVRAANPQRECPPCSCSPSLTCPAVQCPQVACHGGCPTLHCPARQCAAHYASVLCSPRHSVGSPLFFTLISPILLCCTRSCVQCFLSSGSPPSPLGTLVHLYTAHLSPPGGRARAPSIIATKLRERHGSHCAISEAVRKRRGPKRRGGGEARVGRAEPPFTLQNL